MKITASNMFSNRTEVIWLWHLVYWIICLLHLIQSIVLVTCFMACSYRLSPAAHHSSTEQTKGKEEARGEINTPINSGNTPETNIDQMKTTAIFDKNNTKFIILTFACLRTLVYIKSVFPLPFSTSLPGLSFQTQPSAPLPLPQPISVCPPPPLPSSSDNSLQLHLMPKPPLHIHFLLISLLTQLPFHSSPPPYLSPSTFRPIHLPSSVLSALLLYTNFQVVTEPK